MVPTTLIEADTKNVNNILVLVKKKKVINLLIHLYLLKMTCHFSSVVMSNAFKIMLCSILFYFIAYLIFKFIKKICALHVLDGM